MDATRHSLSHGSGSDKGSINGLLWLKAQMPPSLVDILHFTIKHASMMHRPWWIWIFIVLQGVCHIWQWVCESSWRGKPQPSGTPGVDMKQNTHPPESRDSDSLNKTTVRCVENGHKIPNTLNISHSNPGDKSPSDCSLSGPLCEFCAWSRIIPMWQLSSQNSSSLSFKRQWGTFISAAYRLSHAYMTLVYCRQGNIPLVIQFTALVFSM